MVRRWSRRRVGPLRAVSTIISMVLLVGLTVAVGSILWEFHLNLPTPAPTLSYLVRSGTSNPVWGDPTDCTYDSYHFPFVNNVLPHAWTLGAAITYQCDTTATGNYSQMNSTQIVFTQHTPDDISLDEIQFAFVCRATNAMGQNYTTYLVEGSLAAMTWFPGSSTGPAPNAPHLGECGTFIPSGSYSTLYNRLGIFVPLLNDSAVVNNGDTFILYTHTPGTPLDYSGDCAPGYHGNPCVDGDDFHGAPGWCFVVPGACEIYLTYEGYPSTILAAIEIYGIAGVD
jgi:hypothetical protein